MNQYVNYFFFFYQLLCSFKKLIEIKAFLMLKVLLIPSLVCSKQ